MKYLDTDHYLVAQLVNTMQANEDREHPIRIAREAGARLLTEGNLWCVIVGEMPENYIAGFGKTPYEAYIDFNYNFFNQSTNPKHPQK